MTKVTLRKNEKLEFYADLSPLTYKQICQVAGIHYSTFYRILNGEVVPRMSLVKKLCQILGKHDPAELGLNI